MQMMSISRELLPSARMATGECDGRMNARVFGKWRKILFRRSVRRFPGEWAKAAGRKYPNNEIYLPTAT
jgi:hypothetical protein